MQTSVEIHTSPPPVIQPSRKKKHHPKPAHMRGEAPINTEDYLGLPGLRTTAPPEVGDFSILVKAVQLAPNSCPYCQCATKEFQASNGTRGSKVQHLLDEPRAFRRVRIELTRRNFRCEACESFGLLPLWGVGERQRQTERLVRHVEHASLLRPFAEVALATGLSERKVREVFDKHIRQLRRTVEFEPPRVIGLDGITIRKVGRFVVITDVERRLVLHVWNYSRASDKDDSEAATRALVKLLKGMDGAGQIESVLIDMSSQFRCAVERSLPEAKIIIDRFHIQRTANEAVDNVRKRLHEKLKEGDRKAKFCHAAMLRKRWSDLKEHQRAYLKQWFRAYPALRKAYFMKERFCRMWAAGSAAEARERYKQWTRRFAKTAAESREQREMRKDFKAVLSPMEEWGPSVYNYFDLEAKHTNAFTEWANRRIRDMRRECRGCSVEVMRYKLIYGTWLRQQLRRGSRKWGEKTVSLQRTRRASTSAPKKEAGVKESPRTRRRAPRRREQAAQCRLFDDAEQDE